MYCVLASGDHFPTETVEAKVHGVSVMKDVVDVGRLEELSELIGTRVRKDILGGRRQDVGKELVAVLMALKESHFRGGWKAKNILRDISLTCQQEGWMPMENDKTRPLSVRNAFLNLQLSFIKNDMTKFGQHLQILMYHFEATY